MDEADQPLATQQSGIVAAPFDEALAVARLGRAIKRDPDSNFLVGPLVEDLLDRLAAVQRSFASIAVLFQQTNHLGIALQQRYPNAEIKSVIHSDAASRVEPRTIGQSDARSSLQTFGTLGLTADLAISMMNLHAINDVTGFLIQARRNLVPDGLFMGCLVGAGSLAELRETLLTTEAEMFGGAAPRIAPLADVRDMGALLQRAGFALPVADADTITLRHNTLFDLIRDLRALGLTNVLNARSRRPLTRAFWAQAAENHAKRFAGSDGRIPASLNIIWLSGWAPAPSQPKALQPGSATVSLKDVLK
jgi:hypothetical protein